MYLDGKNFPALKISNRNKKMQKQANDTLSVIEQETIALEKCVACHQSIYNGRTLRFCCPKLENFKSVNPNLPLKSLVFNGRVDEKKYEQIQEIELEEFKHSMKRPDILVSKESTVGFEKFHFECFRVCKRCRSYCLKSIETWWDTARYCPCHNQSDIHNKLYFACFFDLSYLQQKGIPFVETKMIGYHANSTEIGTFMFYSISCCQDCTNYWMLTVISGFYSRIQILKNDPSYDTDD